MAPRLEIESIVEPCWEHSDDASREVVAAKEASSSSSTSRPTRPVGILREPTFLPDDAPETMPSHWPSSPSSSSSSSPGDNEGEGCSDDDDDSYHSARSDDSSSYHSAGSREAAGRRLRRTSSNSVRFSPQLESSTRFRPRTHVLDVPKLFYSARDIKRFKREYRNLVRAQNLARERMERNSAESVEGGPAEAEDVVARPSHDNSFWRSKVGRRWTAPPARPAAASTPPSDENPAASEDGSDNRAWDPLNDGSVSPSSSDDGADNRESSQSYGGIFSSVFDVARDAVSVLGGGSGYYYSSSPSHNSARTSTAPSTSPPRRRTSATSLHLVDTLYLF